MARHRVKTTRLDIIRRATTVFLEQGYSASSTKQIAEDLDIGTGNLTYYFPTKEHLLAELVDMLCGFQWKMMEVEANDGISSVVAICLELTIMAAACEMDTIIKDFFISAYSSPRCLEIIRRNDSTRSKQVFAAYCPDWTEEQFAAAEVMVSGLEYATLMTAGEPVPLETRLRESLNCILQIYNIPEQTREMKIQRVLKMDYRGISKRVLDKFKNYVARANEQALEELYREKGFLLPESI